MDEARTGSADTLFDALYGGTEDTVLALLRAGAPAEATDEDGQTPLYLAAVAGEPGIVRLLLVAGADPDRPSGPDRDDLPLCGAAVGGHTEVVRALLAAGASPDRREALGFTALAWAVGQGHTATVEALLEHGADPDLPFPGGEAPLVVAARRGSPSTVRALLRHGAGARAEALDEARAWLERDVETSLRQALLTAYGPDAGTVSRRIPEDGGVTVVVEVLRDGRPAAGNEQQTGHGAIATLLETALGVRTPYATLAGRALREGDPERDDWTEPVAALRRRGDEETFQAAAAWCASDDPLHRAFAADVLAGLGFDGARQDPAAGRAPGARGEAARRADGVDRPFAARALPLLRELSRGARHPEPVRAAVRALGRYADPSAVADIARHAAHPDAPVRRQVAAALCGLVPADGAEGLEALIALAGDPDPEVGERATASLAGADADTPEIREALAARLDDRDPGTAAEAARGLAIRQDPRAGAALSRLLTEQPPSTRAHRTAAEAVRHLADPRLRTLLESITPRRP